MSLVLIHPAPDEGWADMRLADVLSHALAGRQVRVIRRAEELNDLTGQQLLFAAALGEYGVNLELTRMLSALRRTPDLLSGATAGIIIDGLSPLYTKSTAGELALAANLAGCALVGRPLVEGAGQLHNFRIQAKNAGTDLLGAYRAAAADLAQRVETAGFPARERPELLVLHASSHHTSNTMALWAGVRERLGEVCSVQEIGLRNGTLDDCSGCPYTMCIHFGEKGECFYGGVMSREVYPAVRRADGVYVYQLAVTVDDGEAGVTEVVRGMDLLSSAPRQMYLQELLDFPHPAYAHVPMLLAPDGRRLSKRDKDLDLGQLRTRVTPERLIGTLAFSAGLIERNEPVSARELAGEFRWDKLRRESIFLNSEQLI